MNLQEWQDEFFAAPFVWGVYVEGELGNLYETEKGADYEVDFHKRRRCPRVYKRKVHIMSDELARTRWEPKMETGTRADTPEGKTQD